MADFTPDRVLFVFSQPYLSRRRERLLADGLCRLSPLPARCVRLEGAGVSLPQALATAVAEGARAILVQPVGLPFSESLSSWLPGALAHWQASAPPELQLRLGNDLALAPTLLGTVAAEAIGDCAQARPIEGVRPSLGPRGWSDPGTAEEHLFVCTGQRCHFREAPRLRALLQDELRRAGLLERCQVTESSCLGPCNLGPLVARYPDGSWYRLESLADVKELVATVLVRRDAASRLRVHRMVRAVSAAETAG